MVGEGEFFLDCRDPSRRLTKRLPRSSLFAFSEEDETALSEGADEAESQKRLEERWNFDIDDMPPVGPDGAEEHDRHFIDDYDPGYVFLIGTFLRKELNIAQILKAAYN